MNKVYFTTNFLVPAAQELYVHYASPVALNLIRQKTGLSSSEVQTALVFLLLCSKAWKPLFFADSWFFVTGSDTESKEFMSLFFFSLLFRWTDFWKAVRLFETFMACLLTSYRSSIKSFCSVSFLDFSLEECIRGWIFYRLWVFVLYRFFSILAVALFNRF